MTANDNWLRLIGAPPSCRAAPREATECIIAPQRIWPWAARPPCGGKAARRRQCLTGAMALIASDDDASYRTVFYRGEKRIQFMKALTAARPTLTTLELQEINRLLRTLWRDKDALVAIDVPYVAQQAVEHYHGLAPGDMLIGLGMAETTPGPLISVVQFVGFMAAFPQPGVLDPVLAGTTGRDSRKMGHPVYLHRRALHRSTAQQQGPKRCTLDNYRRCRWRHPQSRRLVRPPHPVRAG